MRQGSRSRTAQCVDQAIADGHQRPEVGRSSPRVRFRLVEHGVPLSQVRDLLGHASDHDDGAVRQSEAQALQEAAKRLDTGGSCKFLRDRTDNPPTEEASRRRRERQ